ncbi:MAG: GTP-binding protein, partial [bacterium]
LDRLCHLLDDLSTDIFRAKGIVSAADLSTRLIFHLVGGRWTLSAGDTWGPGEERLTEMVFIGKNLTDSNRAALESRVLACAGEHSE